MNASWDAHSKTGTGVLCYNQTGRLIHARYHSTTTSTSVQTEAMALLKALNICTHRPYFTLLSDCQVLVRAVIQDSIDDLPSWEAANTVAECIALFSTSQQWLIKHVRKGALQGAQKLANWARTTRQNFKGQIFDSFITELDIAPTTKHTAGILSHLSHCLNGLHNE